MKYKNVVIENMMTRRSIRNYKEGAVARETMDEILNCGINAPSGMNRQSWEVRVIDNPETIARFKSLLVASNPETKAEAVEGCFRGAPTLVFVANDPSYDFSPIDCGLLSENIMLSAWSLGVGSICLGSPVRMINENPACAPILERLGFSDGYEFCLCVGLGYADETPAAKPRDKAKVKYVE
jgi:nitroreductase